MVRLLIVLLLWPMFAPALRPESSLLPGIPDRHTPKELASVWLLFHETGLCQGVDATFAFSEKGLEVLGEIEDEKNYQKLREMLRPLQRSYTIVLNLARREEEANPDEKKDRDPPASLWENYELRSFLGDPIARARERAGYDDDSLLHFPPPDELLKQRLLIYAEQVLDWNRKMERYAKHLRLLTRVSADQSLASGLRAHANAVGKGHAREMARIAGKLSASLEPAFPYSGRRGQAIERDRSDAAERTIVERADHISAFAQDVCQRVYQFIYPGQFTVEVNELRQPSLLELLKGLEKMSSEFQKALAKVK